MYKNLTITSLLGAVSIILGAFGAHLLKNKLSIDQMASFETGVRYQMYHVIVLLFVTTFSGFTSKEKNTISFLFFSGIIFFSGSIYAIQLLNISAKSIWFITPLGGLLLIIGWIFLSFYFFKKRKKSTQ